MKKAKNIVERMFERKFRKGFNPTEPNDELMGIINEERLSKSRWFNPDTKGKLLTELSIDQLEYIAFRLENGSHRLHILAELYYFIRLYQELDKQGLDEEDFNWAFKEHFGFSIPQTEVDRMIEKHMEAVDDDNYRR